jgi:hypothetical protein
MGQAVWLYMWLVDKMTSFSEEGIGKVLGGKPINYPEVKKELGISQDTYTRWIEKLAAYPYIEVTRTPYGIVFQGLEGIQAFWKENPQYCGIYFRTSAESLPKIAAIMRPVALTQVESGRCSSRCIKASSAMPESNKTVSVRDNTKDRDFFLDSRKIASTTRSPT